MARPVVRYGGFVKRLCMTSRDAATPRTRSLTPRFPKRSSTMDLVEDAATATYVAHTAPGIWAHAVDTFGTPERALRWMRMHLAELHYRTPEEVLASDPQSAEVDAI